HRSNRRRAWPGPGLCFDPLSCQRLERHASQHRSLSFHAGVGFCRGHSSWNIERLAPRPRCNALARRERAEESLSMVEKIFFGFVVTVAAIVVLLLALGIILGLLAPFLGSVPISYNFRSIRARWSSTIVAILGIAGTVGVFVAMLSLARGFQATLVASGSPGNALVMRAGSASEMMGGITLDSIKVLQDAPGVARDPSGTPLLTQDVVGVMPIPLISTGTDANVQVRGVSPNVLQIRTFVKIAQGR